MIFSVEKDREIAVHIVFSLLFIAFLFAYPSTQSVYSADTLSSPVKAIKTSTIAGSDIGYKINQANAACGNITCEITVDESGKIATPVKLSPDRKLMFEGDHYTFSTMISLNSDNEVAGLGINNTIIQRDPSFYAGKSADKRTSPPSDFNNLEYGSSFAFNVNGKTNVSIHDLTIDGNAGNVGYYDIEGYTAQHMHNGKIFHYPKGAQSEIFIMNSMNVDIDKIKIENINKLAIGVVGSSNVTLENSELSSNGWNGDAMFWAGKMQNHNLVIKNNYMHGASHCAIYIGNTSDARIEGNNIDANRQNSYFTGTGGQIDLQYDTTNIIVQENRITNAGYVPASEVPKINHNLVGFGLEVHGTFIIIQQNYIANNTGAGIWVGDNTNISWIGNKIYPDGIQNSPAHDITISGNTLIGNGNKDSDHQIFIHGNGVYSLKEEFNAEE